MLQKPLAVGLCLVAMLAACQKAPEPITPQPIYDKYGGVIGCEGGTFVPGSAEMPCLPPPDECDPQSTAMPCPPPDGGRDPNDSSVPGGQPGASPTAP